MLRFIKLTLGLLIAALAFQIGLRGAATLAASRESALTIFTPLHCTPSPCWHGLHPGATSLAQARSQLDAAAKRTGYDSYAVCRPNDPACWQVTFFSASNQPTDALSRINVQVPRQAVLFGDLVLLYGPPTSAMLCWIVTPTNGDVHASVQRPVMVGYVMFKGGVRVNLYHPNSPRSRRFDPHMVVDQIYYQPGMMLNTPEWRGFTWVPKLGCGR
jgi:hypothetical protein